MDFAYVIRFKGNILVGYPGMELVPASDWLTPTGRTRTLKEVELTNRRQRVDRVYCFQKSDMKEPWFLACNRVDLSAAKALQLYGQRWGIETSCRDIKDYKFGMGMGEVRISNTARRDRLFRFSALAIVLPCCARRVTVQVWREPSRSTRAKRGSIHSFDRVSFTTNYSPR